MKDLRNMRIGRTLVGTLGLLLALTGCSADGTEKKPDALPPITLPVIDSQGTTGEELDLSTLQGPAVINVWASWCKPCIAEMPLIEEFAAAHPEVTVLGINYTDKDLASAQRLLTRTGVTYQNVFDESGEINNQGAVPRVRGMPLWMFVDADGKVTESQAIPMESTEQITSTVDAALPGVLEESR